MSETVTDLSPRIAEVCDAAADAIDRVGWCQGVMVDGLGRMCAAGAVREVARSTPEYRLTLDALVAQLGARPGHHDRLAAYNDAAGRRQREVVALLRRTAGSLREKGHPFAPSRAS